MVFPPMIYKFSGMDTTCTLHDCRATVKPDARGLQAGSEPAGTVQNAQMVVLARKRLAALLDCLERLLTQPTPTPVPVPGSAVVQLCARILSVDDSLVQAGKHTLSAYGPNPQTTVPPMDSAAHITEISRCAHSKPKRGLHGQ